MPVHTIPIARNSTHFVNIQNSLALVLDEVKNVPALATAVLWVTCRLNRTGETDSPVFVGWFEDIQAIKIRIQRRYLYPPVDIRFGDTHPSRLYSECLSKPPGEVVRREWGIQRADATSQETGRHFYGETHRRSMPININNLNVGTLNIAFLRDPSAEDKRIEDILERWAQNASSDLVQYIRDNLEFSGKKPPPKP